MSGMAEPLSFLDLIEPLSFFDFFDFCAERMKIFHNRFTIRQSPPWTEDPILSKYFFTNCYRELDRTSIWLITKVLREQGAESYPEDLLFSSIIMRRCFNRPETYKLILRACLDDGGETLTSLSPKEFLHNRSRILRALTEADFSLYSHAYTLISKNNKGSKTKTMIYDVLTKIARHPEYLNRVVEAKSPQECLDRIREIPFLAGGFLSYEVFCDMNYCEYFLDRWGCDGEQSIVSVGPGARKGLVFVYPEQQAVVDNDYGTFSEDFFWKSWVMYLYNKSLGHDFPHLFDGRKLSLRGIEHSLCEYSKYMRLYNMENNSGQRTHQRLYRSNPLRDEEYLQMLNSQEFTSLYKRWRELSPSGFV